ncbi:MAG: hypothetical protein JO257_16245 [Deltaproteobacteria bacterium]|nr:hypothetical protein [Deltaproteobacteria bacterium]
MEAALAPLHRRLIRAPSGRDALATLLETDVTVILLDVWMPEMDGFETAELVRGCGAAEAAPLARNESPQLAGASSRRDAYRPDRTAHRSGSEPK